MRRADSGGPDRAPVRGRWHAAAALLVGAAFAVLLIVRSSDDPSTGRVTILHLNDVYRIGGIDRQRRGGLARVAWLRRDLERQGETVIVTHGGDALAPSLLADWYKGEKMVEILNLVAGPNSGEPLLFAIGNHEFDHSSCISADPARNLAVLRQRIEESRFAWLAGNVDFSKNAAGTACQGWDPGAAPGKIQRVRRISVNGLDLGFFGLSYPPDSTESRIPATLQSNAAAAREFVRELRGNSDIVIGLTHQEQADDVALLETGPPEDRPDLVLGGHDHDYRACVDHGEVPGLKRLYKGGAEALDVVLIRLWKDRRGKVAYAQQRIALDQHVAANAAVQARIDRIMDEHQRAFCERDALDNGTAFDPKCLEEVYGRTTTEWVLEELRNRGEETAVGNWLARLVREDFGPRVPGGFCEGNVGTAALLLAGSLRLNFDLPAGREVTRRELEETLPYDREPQHALCLSGAAVYRVLAHGLGQRYDGGWPHFSGLRAAVDSRDGTLAPAFVADDGRTLPIRPASDERLVLIVPDYVKGGGDGYPLGTPDDGVSEVHTFGPELTIKRLLRDALLKNQGPEPGHDGPDGRKAWGLQRSKSEAC